MSMFDWWSRHNVSEEDLQGFQEGLKKEMDGHKSQELENTNKGQVKDDSPKPTVVSIEDLSNRKYTIINNSQTLNSNNFQPFRLTDVFKNEFMMQQENMLNHSFFEKSLSPIIKTVENPEIGSPWRTPQLLTFSQVKDVFQSTPQNKKYDVANNRFARKLNNESKSYGSTSIKNISQKNNENVSQEAYIGATNYQKKNLSASRKFGTEITNINHSPQSNPEVVNEQFMNEDNNMQLANTINFDTNNIFNSSDIENKENSMSNHQSQRTIVRQEMKQIKSQNSQKSALNVQMNEQKENLDLQPGPSGLQNCSNSNDQRILTQSNLNNFLNIKEVPQSATIRTPHRIFDDTHSTLVNYHKPLKKLNEASMELKNAFGFIDEDSDEDASPTKYKTSTDNEKQEKAVQTNLENEPFTRLSLNEIKDKLLAEKQYKKRTNLKNEKIRRKKSPTKGRNKNKIDITNFSDTFDVLSEMGGSSTGNTSDVPLFADLEPTHFIQPPKYSYKRKRAVKYSLSEVSDEEEEHVLEHKMKRKKGSKMKLEKGSKMKQEQEKRLMNWIDDINKIFSEIDQHELVIE